MASNLPPHGEILRLSEIFDMGPTEMSGKFVRVMGKLTKYDPVGQRAIITANERNSTYQLAISTKFIEPFQSRLNSMFQFIGEFPSSMTTEDDMIVQARLVRCVDAIDTMMYYNACDVQRRFLQSRNPGAAATFPT